MEVTGFPWITTLFMYCGSATSQMGSSPQKKNLLVNALGQEVLLFGVLWLAYDDPTSQRASSTTDNSNEIKDIEKG